MLDIFSIKWYIVHVKKTEEDKTMKKFIAIVMSLVLIASVAMLAGCGKKDDVKAAKVIGIDLTNENYAFGVDKAQPELLEKTNAFIDKILSNDELIL